MLKKKVVKKEQLRHIMGEKNVLLAVSHPFIVRLYSTFQDDDRLFLLFEYSAGGELFSHLQKHTRFSNNTAKFYIASVVLVFEYLHERRIAYRDLKPENLLLGELSSF